MKHLCVFLVALLAGSNAVTFKDIEDVFKNYVRERNDDLLYSEELDQETVIADSSVEERSDKDAIIHSEVLKNSHSPEIWRVYKVSEKKCDKEIGLVIQAAFCGKPRNRTIYLDYFSTTDKIKPNSVEVPRCDGDCQLGLSCMATKTSEMIVPVQMVNHKTGKRTCGTIVVEKHDSCKCGCAIREEDCKPDRQIYEKDKCRCSCSDPQARLDCELMNRQWDPQTCSCMCAEQRECSTGEMFYDVTCRCQRFMIMSEENEIN